mmetsp:Transcript_41853/g.53916  ORF Transcript_41853/g.53916 Transcript_41853/m.53916 type:complete len:125 (+) Transcript_41853:943-1317(+)
MIGGYVYYMKKEKEFKTLKDSIPISESDIELNSLSSSAVSFDGDELSGAYHIPFKTLALDKKPFAQGGGGQIFKGKYRAANIAAKQVFSCMDRGAMEEFDLEVAMLMGLTHPNILPIYGTTQDL